MKLRVIKVTNNENEMKEVTMSYNLENEIVMVIN